MPALAIDLSGGAMSYDTEASERSQDDEAGLLIALAIQSIDENLQIKKSASDTVRRFKEVTTQKMSPRKPSVK